MQFSFNVFKYRNILAGFITFLLCAISSFAQTDAPNEESCTFYITTATELQNIANINTNTCLGTPTFKLANDIVVSTDEQKEGCSTNWDNSNSIFPLRESIFDGNNKTVSGICINKLLTTAYTYDSAAVFFIQAPTTIKNIALKNIYLKTDNQYNGNTSLFTTSSTASFNILFEKMHLEDVTVEHSALGRGYTGVILDHARGSQTLEFKDITSKNVNLNIKGIANTYQDIYAGILTGYAYGNISITNTNIQANIDYNQCYYNNYAGGFVGYASGPATIVSNSSFTGTINNKYNINTPNPSSTNMYIGGFFGNTITARIENSKVNAQINIASTGYSSYVGGFLGNGTINLENSAFLGNINWHSLAVPSSDDIRVGCIGGYVNGSIINAYVSNPEEDSSKVIITTSHEPGHVGHFVGSIAGGASGQLFLQNSVAKGSIHSTIEANTSGSPFWGGLLGSHSSGEIKNSKFVGKITVEIMDKSPIPPYVGGVVGNNAANAISDTAIGVTTDKVTTLIEFIDHNQDGTTSGSVTSYTYIGGFSGYTTANEIQGNLVKGNISIKRLFNQTSQAAYIGGIAGIAGSTANYQATALSENTYQGTISVSDFGNTPEYTYFAIGGIVGLASNVISSNNSAIAPKGGDLIDLSLNSEDIYASGIAGRTSASPQSIFQSSAIGNINVNTRGTNTSVKIGGVIGCAFSQITSAFNVYQGKITLNSLGENSKESYVGGLIGLISAPQTTTEIQESIAMPSNGLSSGELIEITTKTSGSVYAAGLIGSASNMATSITNGSNARGSIKVISEAPTFVSGLIGNLESSDVSTISTAFFIGGLSASSNEKLIYGLINSQGNTIFHNNYAIDFNGNAKSAANINGQFIGFGTSAKKEASIYINSLKLLSAQPQSSAFAAGLRAFGYDPTQNEGYPFTTDYDNGIIWVENGKIIADANIKNGKAYLANGAELNHRIASKIATSKTTITKDSIKFVYWSTNKDGIETFGPTLLWEPESVDVYAKYLNAEMTLAFFKDSITIAKPTFTLKTNDTQSSPINENSKFIIWNGDNYEFAENVPLPTAFVKESEDYDYARNTYWDLYIDEQTSFAVKSFHDLKYAIIQAITNGYLDKSNPKITLFLPPWYKSEEGYQDASTRITYINLKSQDLVITNKEIAKDLKFTITQNFNEEFITVPKASKIKFNNDDDIDVTYYDNDNLVSRTIKGKDSIEIPEYVNYVFASPHVSYKIKLDTAGISKYNPIIAYSIPTEFTFYAADSIAFPPIASTEACFTGWEIEYQSIHSDAAAAAIAPSPFVQRISTPAKLYTNTIEATFRLSSKNQYGYFWSPDYDTYGDIIATPVFTEQPCNQEIQLKYGESVIPGTIPATIPEDLQWKVTLGKRNFEVTNNGTSASVQIPSSPGFTYSVHANSKTSLQLIKIDDNDQAKVIFNNEYTVEKYNNYKTVSAISLENLATTGKVQITTWKTKEGKTIYQTLQLPNDSIYNITNGSISADMSSMPRISFRKNGKAFYYFSEQLQDSWNGQNFGNDFTETEIDFLDKIKLFVTDGNDVASIDNIESIWNNVYVQAFDPLKDSLMPTVVAQYQQLEEFSKPTNNRYQQEEFYATNSWTFVHATNTSSVTTTEELLDTIVTYLNHTYGEEFHFYVGFGTSMYYDRDESSYINSCSIQSCGLRKFNTLVKSNSQSDILLTGYLFGKKIEFNIFDSQNIPRVDSLQFTRRNNDSLLVIQFNKNDEMLGYNFIPSNEIYHMPKYSSDETPLTLSLQDIQINKISTQVPETFVFRQFEFPTSYYTGVPVSLPKIASLSTCYESYEVINSNGDTEEYADLWPAGSGNFIWFTEYMSSDVTIKPTTNTNQCKLDTNTINIVTDSLANVQVILTHFGDTLTAQKDKFLMPSGGTWPITVNAIAKAPTTLDSILFNGKSIKNGDTIYISENGIIELCHNKRQKC